MKLCVTVLCGSIVSILSARKPEVSNYCLKFLNLCPLIFLIMMLLQQNVAARHCNPATLLLSLKLRGEKIGLISIQSSGASFKQMLVMACVTSKA